MSSIFNEDDIDWINESVKKADMRAYEKKIIQTYQSVVDFLNKENIHPMLLARIIPLLVMNCADIVRDAGDKREKLKGHGDKLIAVIIMDIISTVEKHGGYDVQSMVRHELMDIFAEKELMPK